MTIWLHRAWSILSEITKAFLSSCINKRPNRDVQLPWNWLGKPLAENISNCCYLIPSCKRRKHHFSFGRKPTSPKAVCVCVRVSGKTGDMSSKRRNCGYPGVKHKRCDCVCGTYCWIRPPLAGCPPILSLILDNKSFYENTTTRLKDTGFYFLLLGWYSGSTLTFFHKAQTRQVKRNPKCIHNLIKTINRNDRVISPIRIFLDLLGRIINASISEDLYMRAKGW